MKSVHGTGDVVRQILRYKCAQANIRSVKATAHFADKVRFAFLCSVTSERNYLKNYWMNFKKCSNFYIAGSIQTFTLADPIKADFACVKLGVQSIHEIQSVQRVQCGSVKFYSKVIL